MKSHFDADLRCHRQRHYLYGATPVFIDSDRATWNMDPTCWPRNCGPARRGKLPKAVVVVDLYGQCADYEPILQVCRRVRSTPRRGCRRALGATYAGRSAGTFGAVGRFSFNGNKIITTSGGGMLVSDNPGMPSRPASSPPRPAIRRRTTNTPSIGYNYRMSNLLAAIGRGQFRNARRCALPNGEPTSSSTASPRRLAR